MNEASVTAALRDKFKANGFFVRKIADKSTMGIPDLLLAKEYVVTFLEVKFLERQAIPIQFTAFSTIKVGPQLMTMVELQNHGIHAYYALVFRVPKMKLQVALVNPTDMLESIQQERGIPLELMTFDELIVSVNQLSY